MRKKLCRILRFNAISAIACASLASCAGESWQREDGMIWNTSYHITYMGNAALADSVLKVLDEVGGSLSVFNPESLVSRINRADSLDTDAHFRAVYMMSQRVNKASRGMFDPTLSPLITAWGFGPGHSVNADTTAIDSVLQFVGMAKTRLEDDRIIKEDRRTQFNFSAVAKGYGCDAVAEMLRRNGVENFLVEIGGEITLAGHNPQNGKWRISIDAPVLNDSSPSHDSCAVIDISDCGVATSGNYRNFRKEGGQTLGHTLSPLTGRPVSTDILSATVIAPTCMEADAAATACMAAGSATAKEMLEKLGLEGLLVFPDSIWTTSGFPH